MALILSDKGTLWNAPLFFLQYSCLRLMYSAMSIPCECPSCDFCSRDYTSYDFRPAQWICFPMLWVLAHDLEYPNFQLLHIVLIISYNWMCDMSSLCNIIHTVHVMCDMSNLWLWFDKVVFCVYVVCWLLLCYGKTYQIRQLDNKSHCYRTELYGIVYTTYHRQQTVAIQHW